jgi:hypothetical protein
MDDAALPNGPTAEHRRLATSTMSHPGPWKRWGAFLSERAWGTVREDYSADGTAWDSFPHDHARSRAYRWSEDGLAGICDSSQQLCLALALWNGNDAILKERIFGLTGSEGNHGEDAKEYWWYLDATPTHSWLTWRYHYPQRAFPYTELVTANAERGRDEPEYELLDTGVFDEDRFFVVTVDHAKSDPTDICTRITVTNVGPDDHRLEVLPTLWFRNNWSWNNTDKPTLRTTASGFTADHHNLGHYELSCSVASDGTVPSFLVCENETNGVRLFGPGTPSAPYPKDAIADTVVTGVDHTNPVGIGTKGSARYQLMVPAGATVTIDVRLRPAGSDTEAFGAGHDAVRQLRRAEADEFYAHLGHTIEAEDRLILRQASAGMIWGQQFFHYDVTRWLDGDAAQPTPPERRRNGRNAGWRHLNAHDIMSMPDPWEYPWFAAWDLAFHAVALAHLDAEFAKHQLELLCREWFMHPNGALPAYEWAFNDVNPPVHAWAAMRVFEIDGAKDFSFLAGVFQKLLINFTWWVNRTDHEGNNVFEGGFLGLDNVSVFDRSAPLPPGDVLEQADGTAWMAMYCLDMLQISLVLAGHDPSYEPIATKFFEHFAYISTALNTMGLWDETDGFYYDILRRGNGEAVPLRARSIVGLIPMFGVLAIDPTLLESLPDFHARSDWFVQHRPQFCANVAHVPAGADHHEMPLRLSVVPPDRLRRILARALDPAEFLSDHGLRALSRAHLDHPFEVDLGSGTARVDYEPAESTTATFGGNSNWRGPVWMPVNVLAVEALRRFSISLGEFTVPHPSLGPDANLAAVADDLAHRLIGLFRSGTDGRPVFSAHPVLRDDPRWRDQLLFHEYFHGDTGAGLGASHQTGWTGLVIDLLLRHTAMLTARR